MKRIYSVKYTIFDKSRNTIKKYESSETTQLKAKKSALKKLKSDIMELNNSGLISDNEISRLTALGRFDKVDWIELGTNMTINVFGVE